MAGHRLTVIDDFGKLEATLRSATFDVLLADYENASMIERMLSKIPESPMFLRVIDAQSNLGKNGEKKYGCLLNPETPRKQKHFLAVLDEAVEASLKARPVICDIREL